MEAAVEFKHPLYQLQRNTKHNGRGIFTRYPVNASENGDFNRGRKSLQANTMLKITFVLGSELYVTILHRECYRTLRYVYVIARAGVIFGIYFTSCRYSGG